MSEQSPPLPRPSENWRAPIDRMLRTLAVVRTMAARDEASAAAFLKEILDRVSRGGQPL